jgi:hypothetical protein
VGWRATVDEDDGHYCLTVPVMMPEPAARSNRQTCDGACDFALRLVGAGLPIWLDQLPFESGRANPSQTDHTCQFRNSREELRELCPRFLDTLGRQLLPAAGLLVVREIAR